MYALELIFTEKAKLVQQKLNLGPKNFTLQNFHVVHSVFCWGMHMANFLSYVSNSAEQFHFSLGVYAHAQ